MIGLRYCLVPVAEAGSDSWASRLEDLSSSISHRTVVEIARWMCEEMLLLNRLNRLNRLNQLNQLNQLMQPFGMEEAARETSETLVRIIPGLLAMASLSGAEVRLLLPVGGKFMELCGFQGEKMEVASEAGKVFALELEPFAVKPLRTGRTQRAPYGVLKGGEYVCHLAAPVLGKRGTQRKSQAVAVVSVDMAMRSRRSVQATKPARRLLRRLSQLLFQEAIEHSCFVDVCGSSAELSIFEDPQVLPGGEPLVEQELWELRRVKWEGHEVIYLKAHLSEGEPQVFVVRSLGSEPLQLGRHALVRSEWHHRLKNNLQSVVSLLRMQARRCEQEDVKEALNDAAQRVMSIAVVHDLLSKTTAERVGLRDLAQHLLNQAAQRFGAVGQEGIRTAVIGPEIDLTPKEAGVLGSVLNELIENCFKHAFPSGDGCIWISLAEDDGSVCIEVKDDGQGSCPQPSTPSSLGLFLVKNLVQNDLMGEFVWDSKPDLARRLESFSERVNFNLLSFYPFILLSPIESGFSGCSGLALIW